MATLPEMTHFFTATVGDTHRNNNVQSIEDAATAAAAASCEVALGEDLWEDLTKAPFAPNSSRN